MKYDVVVVGAGAAGLVCGSLLQKSGNRVAIVERHRYLGGRAMERRFRGHQLGLGSHLVEDPGDSLTRVCELMGVELCHSPPSDSMPFWVGGAWAPIQERYRGASKRALKRCIDAVTEADYGELERWDHASLREWMSQHTSDEGAFTVWEAISVLEQITRHPWEHSASENLFARKLHYSTRRTAGYSFWPMGGWQRLWRELARAFRAAGGTLLQPEVVERVVVEDGAVVGVELRGAEPLEARQVVVSAPVWDLAKLFDDGVLPWDLRARVDLLADDRNRACWLGYWIAAKEPVIAMTEREMASFFATPRTGLPGFTLNFTGYDPGVSPPGEYLTCVGAAFDAARHYGDRPWILAPRAQVGGQVGELVAQPQTQVQRRDVELARRAGARRGQHALDPVPLARALDATEQHPRVGHAGVDRVVGGAQHAGVVLRAALEGPPGVGLVEDLPVPDRAARVGCHLGRQTAELGRVAGGAERDLGAAAGAIRQPARHAEDQPQHLDVVAACQRDDLVEGAPVRMLPAPPAFEDAVQLNVDPDELGAGRARLREDALLHGRRRAARVDHRVRGDRCRRRRRRRARRARRRVRRARRRTQRGGQDEEAEQPLRHRFVTER